MKERSKSTVPDFKNKNVEHVHSLNTGRPLVQRIDLPDNMNFGQYGGQRNNIWEFQKKQLRHRVAQDSANHYTYSKEYLGAAFPVVNETEQMLAEKLESISNWKSPNGFDTL